MAEQEQASEKQLSISKIYVKDASFESPHAPEVFKRADWKPETNLNLRSQHNTIEENIHEIVLTITVEAKEGDKTLFVAELQQAGLFEIGGYEGEELAALAGSYCPNILFPYARQTLGTMIQRGGFPEFLLQPINFDALYMQTRQQQAAAQAPEVEKH